MAQPDLISEKILATNPDQGFGDAAVMPYIQRGFDDRIYQHLGAATEREDQARAARKKADLESMQTLKRPTNETKGNVQLQKDYDAIKQNFAQRIDAGEHIPNAELAQAQGYLDVADAKDKEAHQKYTEHLTNEIPGHEKFYGPAYNSGIAKENAIHAYHDQPRGVFAHSSDPLENHHLYDLRTASKEFAKGFKPSEQSTSNSNEDPERATTVKNSAGAVFMVKDPKTGKLVPGVGQQHIDDFLEEKNGVARNKIDKELVDPVYSDDAVRIKQLSQTDPQFAKYSTMTHEQIKTDLMQNGNPLRKNEAGIPLNQAAYRNQVTKKLLEEHNAQNLGSVVSNEVKSNSFDSKYGGNPETKFGAYPGTFEFTSPQGGQTKRFPAPGVTLKQNGKPVPAIQINPEIHRNLSTGQINSGLTQNAQFVPSHVGTAFMKEDGTVFAGSPEVIENQLRNKSEEFRKWWNAGADPKTRPKDFGGFSMRNVVSGYADTPTSSEGKGVDEEGGQAVTFTADDGSKTTVIRRTVTAPYDNNDAIGSQLNAVSGGTLSKREFTPQELAMRKAFEQYKAAIQGF